MALQSQPSNSVRQQTLRHFFGRHALVVAPNGTEIDHNQEDFTALPHTQKTLKNVLPFKSCRSPKLLVLKSCGRHPLALGRPYLLRLYSKFSLWDLFGKETTRSTLCPNMSSKFVVVCALEPVKVTEVEMMRPPTLLHSDDHNFFNIASNLACKMFLES